MKTFCSRILIAAFLLFQFNTTQAQNCWSSLGAGVGTTSGYSSVVAITEFNGKLIATGQFDTVGGNIPANNIAAWDGTSWSTLGSGISLSSSSIIGHTTTINAMTVYNGDLYVAGTFDTAGGVPVNCIAKWDGTTWSPVGSGIKLHLENDQAFAMAVFNNALYVGGRFDTVGGIPATNIAKWDGSSWSAVAAGLGVARNTVFADSDAVISLAVYNNMLVAGGGFTNASGLSVNNIAAWNGSTWSALGNGVNGGVQSIANYQNDLYTSLINTNAGQSTYFISKWDGSSWSNVVGGPGTGTNYYGYLLDLFPFDGKLLGAGSFSIVNNNDTFTTGIAQWDGSTWSPFLSLTDAGTGYYQMMVYNNYLYASGEFMHAGTTSALNIAEYTCATDGISEITKNHVSIYPNPNNGVVNISIDNVESGSYIVIYDLMGARVYQSEIGSNKSEIDLGTKVPGTYLYKISDGQGANLSSGSFIIE